MALGPPHPQRALLLRPAHLPLSREERRRHHGQLGHLVVSAAHAPPPLPVPDEEKAGAEVWSWLGLEKVRTEEKHGAETARCAPHVDGGAREARERET